LLPCRRPIGELTPYEGIRSVRPGHYIAIRNSIVSQHAHWTSLITTSIHYKEDSQYEEHFLSLFRQSVERRTGPGAPILAQLSGGMDSTSIVCMSDHVRRLENPDAELLDTVSFYDDSEASLNDRPYFSIAESRRGKVGTHIDVAYSQRNFMPHDPDDGIYGLPGADSFSLQQERNFYNAVWQRGFRSILSGIGGDEVLGGVPFAFPELAGYLLCGHIYKFVRQSIAWSLIDRSPLIHTIFGTAKNAMRLYTNRSLRGGAAPPWVACWLVERSREIAAGDRIPLRRWVAPPHRVDNSFAWQSIMETLPHLFPPILYRPEYRCPYLDKDLVHYLFSIPREQLLRPGRRRSLMRRALRNIVPHEILERRRKAFQLRAPLRTLQRDISVLERLFADSLAAGAGFIDAGKLRIDLRGAAQGESEWWQMLLRTIALELWLRASQSEGSQSSWTVRNRPV
jgi:asparagine synthase (glutamine-hydrolysing)